MQVGIFKEYNEAIDAIKARLLELYNKFYGCQCLLEIDYKNGLVSEKEYEHIKKLGIFNYDAALNPKYCLTKEETDYVRLYGDEMADGTLSFNMANKKYLDRQTLLNRIGNSIVGFYYFDNISEGQRKEVFVKAVEERFGPQIAKLQEEIKKLKNALGENYYASINYQKANAELTSLLQEQARYINGAMSDNINEFRALASELLDLDLQYYVWYTRRYIKEECEAEIATTNQEVNIVKGQGLLDGISTKQNELNELNKELYEISVLSATLTSEVIEDSFDRAEEEHKSLFRRKKEARTHNKNELYNLFIYYMKYPVFSGYLEQFGVSKDNVDFLVAFDNYFVKHYQNLTYVNPQRFKRRLLLEVINYLRSLMEELKQKIQTTSTALTDTTSSLTESLSEIKRFETLRNYYYDKQNEILAVDKILKDLGFNEVEIDRIYNDVKEFINTDFTNEHLAEIGLKMKVGN